MICSKLKQLQEISFCMQRKLIDANGYQAFKTTKMIQKSANANVMCEYNSTTPLSTLLNGVPRANEFPQVMKMSASKAMMTP